MGGIKINKLKKNWLLVFVLFIVIPLQGQNKKNFDGCCDTYVCTYKIPRWGKIKEYLLLCDDHTYVFYRDHSVPYDVGMYKPDCRSVCGTWTLQGKHILFKTMDADTIIKMESNCILSKDSIYIKVLKASDGSPHPEYGINCLINDTLIRLETDSNGIFAIGNNFGFFFSIHGRNSHQTPFFQSIFF